MVADCARSRLPAADVTRMSCGSQLPGLPIAGDEVAPEDGVFDAADVVDTGDHLVLIASDRDGVGGDAAGAARLRQVVRPASTRPGS